jgi:hypothetical protein
MSGSGFGFTQGTGAVWLGSAYGGVASWSDTLIVATVAANATSGTVQVQQGGVWSNSQVFTVTRASITSVAPNPARPGDPVTVTGTGFGTAQGTGQVWLGTANGIVQSWSDSQIVAQVVAGSLSGSAEVLQGGVWTTAVPFMVNTLHITSATPDSGGPGTSVTIAGTGFGQTQGTGSLLLGSLPGQVVSWTDTQILATVASGSASGVARVQQGGVWSNALTFTVPGSNLLSPNVLTMVMGDTRTIQALNPAGQVVRGLTWQSSDPTVVSLSTDDPPLLTALAPGHVTITAGAASADVTVYDSSLLPGGTLPQGTVLWSNSGNGSGVTKIVPAVPSANGVADVFAFQADGTVAAITSDGTTAWTADVSNAWLPPVPDFQGGLVFSKYDYATGTWSITRLDGRSGTPYPLYSVQGWGPCDFVVHPDGTVIARLSTDVAKPNGLAYTEEVIGIDPTTGAQKFSVPIYNSDYANSNLIIAGDGYAYVPHADPELGIGWAGWDGIYTHLKVLRVSTSGAYDDIEVYQYWIPSEVTMSLDAITNADQGVLLSWDALEEAGPGITPKSATHMAIVTGGSVNTVNVPQVAGQSGHILPVLQAQDGSFIGQITAGDGQGNFTYNMIAFDQNGTVRWTVPGYVPEIATADGGVIAQAWGPNNYQPTGPAVTFDQNGNATGQFATIVQSWTGNWYQYGSVDQVVLTAIPYYLAASFWALQGGQQIAGTSGTPIDSIANKKVRDILTPARWKNFAGSHCAAVFADTGQGIASNLANYSLATAQKKQEMTNFYDIGNPGVASLMLRAVTGGQISNSMTLTAYLANAYAATVNMGYWNQTAVLFKSSVLTQTYPQFTLMHEVLLHAYGNWWDDPIFGSAYFQQKGLWRPAGSSATTTISSWMSTDCTCTPENPATATTCHANTAKW